MEHPLNITALLPADLQHGYLQVVMLFVALVIITILGLMTLGMRREIPTKSQSFVEGIIVFIYDLGENIMGKEGLVYVPFIFGIGMYVVVSNLIGIVPGLIAPTSNMNTTAAPAIAVFILYNYIGIKKHGMHYIKHFTGPVLVLAPLMIIIEFITHLARPLSLTMRLFGNIAGEDLVLLLLFFLAPLLVPIPMMGMIVFTSLLQTYVFMMLSMVYISGALEEAH